MFKFENDKPIYIQIVDNIYSKIFRGEIKPGDKLPSVRELAIEYTVNPNTIQKVITELENQNVIGIERGKGTFVTNDAGLIGKIKMNYIDNEVNGFIRHLTGMGLKKSEIVAQVKKIIEKGDGND